MSKIRILMLHRQKTGCGYYRSWVPARLLTSLGHEVSFLDGEDYTALGKGRKPLKGAGEEAWKTGVRERVGTFDVLWVDRAVQHEEWGMWAWLKHHSPGARMITDFDDDFTDIPEWNKARISYHPGQEVREAGLAHLKVSELVTVSTPTLAAKFGPMSHAVRVCRNRVDPKDWVGHPVSPERSKDPCLRILYGGADGHFGDVDRIRRGLEAVLRRPRVPWRLICMGAMTYWMYELMREFPERVVNLPWVPFHDYPAAVAWGGFDGAIAPLAPHPFNEAKSNIKWIEAGIQGIPLIASKVGPYAEIPEGCALRVQNSPEEWEGALRALLEDSSLRAALKERASEAVWDSWVMDKGAGEWQTALEAALDRPRIETAQDTVLPGTPQTPEAPAAPAP